MFQLLREVHAGSKSGHLHFFHGGSRRSLRFLEGQVLHGTSDARGEHLGDVLVRYGRLRQADLDQAVEIVLRDRRRLGGVLLTMGLLDRAGLDEAVGLHAREILFDAMGRGDGSFTFEESGPEPLGPDDAASNLSTVELILEAARRVQDPAVVRRVLREPRPGSGRGPRCVQPLPQHRPHPRRRLPPLEDRRQGGGRAISSS